MRDTIVVCIRTEGLVEELNDSDEVEVEEVEEVERLNGRIDISTRYFTGLRGDGT